MQVIDNKKRLDGFVILAATLLIIALFVAAQGCATKRYAYKVTFADGTTDYYELNYKPKQGATAIEYDGETILGVKALERADK